MRLRTLLWSGCLSAAMAVAAVPAAAVHECVAGPPAAASYSWNFKAEANGIFKQIRSAAQDALYHADKLQSFADDRGLDWQTHANQLEDVKSDINDIGAQLCRLETIRRVVAPWQQHTIDQIAADTRLMAGNAQDAILFGNVHQRDLWLAQYQNNLANLDNQARNLEHSVANAVEFPAVSKEYRGLEHKLGD